MEYLRIRNIDIDVIPDSEPFISINIEKIIADGLGNITQVVGNYDRIYKRLHDVVLQPSGHVADDGYIDGMELYIMIATVAQTWVIQEHGGELINGKLVIG